MCCLLVLLVGYVLTLSYSVTYQLFKGYKKFEFTAEQKKKIEQDMAIVDQFLPSSVRKLQNFKTEYFSGKQH